MRGTDPFQTDVARLALTAAQGHGFALAGGHALIAHGIITRPTEDIGLFTDTDDAVRRAADLVQAALTDAGLTVEEISEVSELGDVFYGFEQDMIEYEVRQGDKAVRLQLVRFDRRQSPVIMDIGPVLHLDDVIGTKVAAMVTRAEPRDFIDVAAALDRYSPEQLRSLALRADPALTDEDFTDAMRRLDHVDNTVFEALYGRSPEQVIEIHTRFAAWPRP